MRFCAVTFNTAAILQGRPPRAAPCAVGVGAERRRITTIYIAGVEGTGHHGIMPVVLRAVCARYGLEGTYMHWGPLRQLFMHSGDTDKRAALRELLGTLPSNRDCVMFEWASWPWGEKHRERFEQFDRYKELQQHEASLAHPFNSFNLGEFLSCMREYGEVKVLLLERDFINAAWSRGNVGWDSSLSVHATVVAAARHYVLEVVESFDQDEWCWISYEELCRAKQHGDLQTLEHLAHFLGVSRQQLEVGFEGFKPSSKQARQEASESDLKRLMQIEALQQKPSDSQHIAQWVKTHNACGTSSDLERFVADLDLAVFNYGQKVVGQLLPGILQGISKEK